MFIRKFYIDKSSNNFFEFRGDSGYNRVFLYYGLKKVGYYSKDELLAGIKLITVGGNTLSIRLFNYLGFFEDLRVLFDGKYISGYLDYKLQIKHVSGLLMLIGLLNLFFGILQYLAIYSFDKISFDLVSILYGLFLLICAFGIKKYYYFFTFISALTLFLDLLYSSYILFLDYNISFGSIVLKAVIFLFVIRSFDLIENID